MEIVLSEVKGGQPYITDEKFEGKKKNKKKETDAIVPQN